MIDIEHSITEYGRLMKLYGMLKSDYNEKKVRIRVGAVEIENTKSSRKKFIKKYGKDIVKEEKKALYKLLQNTLENIVVLRKESESRFIDIIDKDLKELENLCSSYLLLDIWQK